MTKYVIKRLLMMIPTLLGVAFIVFCIINLTPGNPGRTILGASAKQEAVDQLNHELGYDQPFLVRFVDYVGGVLQGNLGTSYRTRQPFTAEILARLPFTLRLGVLSIVFSSIIGISLGILSAVRQYSLTDTVSTITAMLFASIPGFFLGMVLIYAFGLRLGWLPTHGLKEWSSYILPVLTLTVGNSALLIRLTRTTMLETIRQDYIRTARAKGCSEKRVIWKHAFKNALPPVLTVLGISFGSVLGGAIICETVFSIPGVGTYIMSAITGKDIPVVMSGTLILSAFFCLIMILVDISYSIIDPRVRENMLS